MLKLGYGMMMLAGAALIGFAAYHVIRLLIVSTAIGLFFKVLIPVGGVGILLTLAGLIRERFREDQDADRNE
ncbi:hypothetical protein KAJ02_09110 [Candidatus Bipolaricaulota bacterium]|nr:hypothetical protein [Candidatus Bipolaricaulota bacterium]MCK5586219.1 hypothetical protein [Candidatus Bipolaricaulota bacterium]